MKKSSGYKNRKIEKRKMKTNEKQDHKNTLHNITKKEGKKCRENKIKSRKMMKNRTHYTRLKRNEKKEKEEKRKRKKEDEEKENTNTKTTERPGWKRRGKR